jgi:hypothetical protein
MKVKGLFLLVAASLFATGAIAEHHGGKATGKGHHTMPAFAEVDADGDGAISAEELTAMHAARMAERAREGGKMKHAGKGCAFESIDADADGKVTPEEFAAHQAEMRQKRHHRHQKKED